MPSLRSRLRRFPTATVLAVALLLPATAGADPVTYVNPDTGAAVTLSSGVYAAGGRLEISGTGFVRDHGTGRPIIAIKPDEQDEQAEVARWSAGGPSALAPIDVGGGEWVLAFVADLDGTFSGWIDLPEDLALTGPGAGANAGQHLLRLLSGLLSTDDGSPTPPINLGVYFSSMDFTYGLTSLSSAWYRGDTFPAGASIAPRGGAFTPSTALAITLDGAPYSATAITTGAGGAIPDAARLKVPTDAAPGRHAFALRTGTTELTQPFTVAAAPTAALSSPTVAPGKAISFTATGFHSIGGGGQKVAVMVGTQGIKACLTAGADGALSGSVPVAADATTESTSPVRLLAGTSCVPGGEQNDLPGRVLQLAVTVVPEPVVEQPAPIAPLPDPVRPPIDPPPVPPTPRASTPRAGTVKLDGQDRKLRVALAGGTVKRVTITVKTAGKVRATPRGPAKVLTVVTARTLAGTATSVTLQLTATARKVLRREGKLKVVVRIAPVGGGTATTKTLTLRA
jgi:hypothetical protein